MTVMMLQWVIGTAGPLPPSSLPHPIPPHCHPAFFPLSASSTPSTSACILDLVLNPQLDQQISCCANAAVCVKPTVSPLQSCLLHSQSFHPLINSSLLPPFVAAPSPSPLPPHLKGRREARARPNGLPAHFPAASLLAASINPLRASVAGHGRLRVPVA